MFSENKRNLKNKLDVNHYTAIRLGDMAESLDRLARAFDDGVEKNGQLTRGDGLAAIQTGAALVCDSCSRCNLYADSEKEDSYYLPYLLRAFEQKGFVDYEDMPQMFRTGCRKQEAYLEHLNRSLGRAAMNLSWKNRFLESRDAVVSQFRELSVILEEFSHQMDQARDITGEYEYIVKKLFRRYHMAVGSLLLAEYENGRREAFLTVRTTNGRCVTSKEAAELLGEALAAGGWRPAGDSRSIITRQYATVRLLEDGRYRMLCGASRIPKQGERYSGDNYTFCESQGSQVVMSLSDGMGSGQEACKESRQVVELTEQLLEAGFSPRAALKLVNTVLLLAGDEQHPATLDMSCVDLYTGDLEVMKLGAVPTFILSEEGVEILKDGQVPMGVLSGVEPVLMSRSLSDGSRIVMVSDGVLDALPGEDKELVMKNYLEEIGEMGPQELADQILEFSLSFIPMPRDDMTVLAAGLWKRRS